MVLMAIDHVRVYAGVPAGGPDPAVFFTRWVTHFCAPAFVFLAGTSAMLGRRRGRELSGFLLTRGLWLVLLELTVIRLAWTFNPGLMQAQMAGVIWAIGCCLLLMAALVRLPVAAVAAVGAAIVFAHNLIPPSGTPVAPLARVLYYGMAGGPIELGGGWSLMVLYSIVPWVGVMALGYGFGAVLRLEPARRDLWCLRLGGGALALFVSLRAFNLYGDPSPWSAGGRLPALLSFLNTSKYPASLLFLLMTLGPLVALVPLLERAKGAVADALATFGRVPFLYYLLHIPLVHALAIVVSVVRTGGADPWLFANHPLNPGDVPADYRWTLGLLYLVWSLAVALLFVPCRWFAELKARRRDWWLGYL